MTRSFHITPSRVVGVQSSMKTFFDTDAFPVSYAPESAEVLLTGQTITFPDFLKGNAYGWQQWDSGDANNNPRESAVSLITMVNQEWGPTSTNPTSGCTLADTVIATIPDQADHIIVQVNLARTTSPSQVNGFTVPVAFKESVWVTAENNCLVMEGIAPYARMVKFYLAATANGDGTRNVLMRRLQSVKKARQYFYRSDNSSTKEGWTYGGTYGSVYGIPVSQRATRGPTTDTTGIGGKYKRTGSSPAATDDNTNYSSVFTGSIKIIPGYAGITGTSGGADPNLPYVLFTDEDVQGSGTTYTFTNKAIGDAGTTRRVIIGFASAQTGSSSRTLVSVKINGTTVTPVISKTTGMSSPTWTAITGIAMLDVPTGTTATIEITFNNTMLGCELVVLAGYNLTSTTAHSTVSGQTINTDFTITTAANSFLFYMAAIPGHWYSNYVYYAYPDSYYMVTGIDNGVLVNVSDGSGSIDCIGVRAFQNANGETHTLRQVVWTGTIPVSYVAACIK